MDSDEFRGRTQQPVIAERQLVRVGTDESLTIRIYQPEFGGTVPGRPWRCGFLLLGLPGLPEFYGPESELADGEVWFDSGEDSFHALTLVLADVRAMLDRVEEEFNVTYVWPACPDWGHKVPRWVAQSYGRHYEQRLLDVMEQEDTRLSRTRTPNPYAWDDPRHPSYQIRQQAEDDRRKRDAG